jgi:hypothetical protein
MGLISVLGLAFGFVLLVVWMIIKGNDDYE